MAWPSPQTRDPAQSCLLHSLVHRRARASHLAAAAEPVPGCSQGAHRPCSQPAVPMCPCVFVFVYVHARLNGFQSKQLKLMPAPYVMPHGAWALRAPAPGCLQLGQRAVLMAGVPEQLCALQRRAGHCRSHSLQRRGGA